MYICVHRGISSHRLVFQSLAQKLSVLYIAAIFPCPRVICSGYCKNPSGSLTGRLCVPSDLSRAISHKFYKLNSMPFDGNFEDAEAKGGGCLYRGEASISERTTQNYF
jgi:hypothetical protein